MLKTKAPSLRQKKVSELLRRLVSSFFIENNFSLNGNILACSSVRVSKDLRTADIFLTIIGSDNLQNNNLEIDVSGNVIPRTPEPLDLDKTFTYNIKSYIGKNTELKFIPNLRFYQ